jgi:hypothetical protein
LLRWEIDRTLAYGTAATYTRLTVETFPQPVRQRSCSVHQQGIPAVLTIEGADNTNSRIHSSNDTIDHVKSDLAVEILRMNVAFVARELNQMP